MTDIQPGDWVKCVDASPGAWSGVAGLVLGATYQVQRVVLALHVSGDALPTFRLDRGNTPDPDDGWASKRFRKLNRLTETFRAKLLEPVDLDVTA